MPPAVVVMQRNSRQMLKSFAEGSQPLAMASSLPGCRPTNSASAARLGFFGCLAGFLQRGQFRFRQPSRPGGGSG